MKIIITCLLLLYSSIAISQPDFYYNEVEHEKAYGLIKSLRTYSYELEDKFGVLVEKPYNFRTSKHHIEDYLINLNRDNKIIEKIQLNAKGDTLYMMVCKYIKHLPSEINYYNANGSIDEKVLFFHNQDNKVSKQAVYGKGGLLIRDINYFYNDKKLIDSIIDIKPNKEYGEEIKQKWKCIYDNNDLLVKTLFYYNDKIYNKEYFYYDSVGDLSKNEIYSPNDELIKIILISKSSNLKVEEIYKYYDDNIRDLIKLTYKNNDLIKLEKYEGNDSSPWVHIEYKYKYDSLNNWISKTFYKNHFPQIITYRNIEYY